MKTIAITAWNGIVSPLYDAACCLCIQKADGVFLSHSIRMMSPADKITLCEKEQVAVLICGAISLQASVILQEKGIRVLSWVCGPVDMIIAAYRSGGDVTTSFAMPGCRCTPCGKVRFRHSIIP